MYIQKHLSLRAKNKKTPDDWCFVYNFSNPNEPLAIRLKPGEGRVFRDMMDEYKKEIRDRLQEGFKEDALEQEKSKIQDEFEKEKTNLVVELNKLTRKKGFEVVEGSNGLFMLPVVKGKTLSKQEFEQLDSKLKIEFEAKSTEIQEYIFDTLIKIKEKEITRDKKLEEWKASIASIIIDKSMVPLLEHFIQNKKVIYFLKTVKDDIIKNIDEFLKKDYGEAKKNNQQMMQRQEEKPWENYEVNLFVDNSELQGAPVVMDINYTFENIFGKVEYENKFGVLETNYKKIKPGLIHKANGGYLVFQAKEFLSTPMAYDILKRAIKVEKIGMEVNPEQRFPMMLVTLKPESIPLDVKVILIGHADIYDFLIHKDEDFKKLFKIKVEFEETAKWSEENEAKLCKFISSYCTKEKLLNLENAALVKVVEKASALAGEQDKLSTNFAELGKLVAEASILAKMDGKDIISPEYIDKVETERIERIKKYDNKITEMIQKDMLLIETTGKKVGQINGLGVLTIGDYSFGKPNKITANTYMGTKGVINIEREIKMSGPMHSKGVYIISGYLGQKFAQNFPLSVNASVCFEQLYGKIDGDSASSTEIYAILSNLSGLGITQEIAVTGSVNQKGYIQPIGGVNEKIKGFYNICKLRGLTKRQGVIIPKQNIENLYLPDEIIEAVKNGLFHIYAISTIDEGIEILTGVPAGKMNEKGEYPQGTVNYLVYNKLKTYGKKEKN